MERAVILTRQGPIKLSALPVNLQPKPLAAAAAVGASSDLSFPVGMTVMKAERELILRTLDHTKQNKAEAAEMLGITLKALQAKLKEYEE